jgi:hypothetical protein
MSLTDDAKLGLMFVRKKCNWSGPRGLWNSVKDEAGGGGVSVEQKY